MMIRMLCHLLMSESNEIKTYDEMHYVALDSER